MVTSVFVAFLEPEQIAVMIPIIIFMIPIIAILTTHQRKMAELYHSKNANQYNPEIAALRQEMVELKQLIHQQAIALDNVASLQAKLIPHQTLEDRIGNQVG